MNDIEALAGYLERITGQLATFRKIAAQRLAGLPVHLTAAYRFQEWSWLDRKLVLTLRAPGVESAALGDLKAHHGVLERHFAGPVVFVLPALDAYSRNRLIHMGVPFVVPGLQLFIPPFASLCEHFQRTVRVDRLSAAAQVTVLYQLFRHPSAPAMLNQWAAWLGYSAMTMTKVRNELVASGLCTREIGSKPRGLRFVLQGRSLWDAALPFLRSPVRRGCWARSTGQLALLPAGLTALAKMTLIEDDSIPTYACRDAVWNRLVRDGKVNVLTHQDEASARVECWRYAPELPAGGDMVDRLSLFLSISGSTDERVRMASQSILDGMPW